jgi:hypothetical protein
MRARTGGVLTRCGPRLRVAVKDHGSGPPHLQDAGSSGLTGRGMVLVDALCESQGVLSAVDPGKVVWAVILERPWTAPRRGGRRTSGDGSHAASTPTPRGAGVDTP